MLLWQFNVLTVCDCSMKIVLKCFLSTIGLLSQLNTAVNYTAMNYTAMNYTAMNYTAMNYTAMSYIAMNYTAMNYTAMNITRYVLQVHTINKKNYL